MLERLKLLRNIGMFDSVSAAANIPLAKLTLVFAENGRGKTTLAAILRSLATGDPLPIIERRRLAAQHPPQVVLDHTGEPTSVIFENGAWNRSIADIAVFDDVFVDENVCSGLSVETGHRQRLHGLILGSEGVELNRELQQLVKRIEDHNSELRIRAAAIPTSERGSLTVDEFCALGVNEGIDTAIAAAERKMNSMREREKIKDASPIPALVLPPFDLPAIEQVLTRDLSSLDKDAANRVAAHIQELGDRSELWIAEGMKYVQGSTEDAKAAKCPFCAQDLSGSRLVDHYRAYFSVEYEDLKRSVMGAIDALDREHGGDALASFERAVRMAGERRQFWSEFCEVSDISLDTEAIAQKRRLAYQAIRGILEAKQAAPLETMTLDVRAVSATEAYEEYRNEVEQLNQAIQKTNTTIEGVKEQVLTGDREKLEGDLALLKAAKARHSSEIDPLCRAYCEEKTAKTRTEEERDRAREALDEYRAKVFPNFQTAINQYLGKFNAGFRIDSVNSANTRSGPTCTYHIVINNTRVEVAGGTPSRGEASFRNTLSSGDRNALALAFFLASLDQDSTLSEKVVVIDDPIASLDEHRSLTTAQEIRRLAGRANQVIVLSHNKPFLSCIWEGADRESRAAICVSRDSEGSTLELWDVTQNCITEHDRRHATLREYALSGAGNSRDVASVIRPVIEAFLRVAYPEHFSPEAKLGQFRRLCQERLGTDAEILNARDTEELADLSEYASKYHHETNPAWATEIINETELTDFVQRTLEFTRRQSRER
jgi:wobble nucleotide-excising tRNase